MTTAIELVLFRTAGDVFSVTGWGILLAIIVAIFLSTTVTVRR